MTRVSVQTGPFDPGSEAEALERLGAGAIATFTGLVRNDDGVDALTLEHYPGMTEAALEALLAEAEARWSLAGARIVHRVGRLDIGARIVFVGTASAHRKDALEACAFLIDRLKTDAPFWKKEDRAGAESWVAARETDEDAAARWED
jgi:molybdopterin synthase catalytic subunit